MRYSFERLAHSPHRIDVRRTALASTADSVAIRRGCQAAAGTRVFPYHRIGRQRAARYSVCDTSSRFWAIGFLLIERGIRHTYSNTITVIQAIMASYSTTYTEDTVLLAPPAHNLSHRQRLAVTLRKNEKAVLRNNMGLLRWRWTSFLAQPENPLPPSPQFLHESPSPIESVLVQPKHDAALGSSSVTSSKAALADNTARGSNVDVDVEVEASEAEKESKLHPRVVQDLIVKAIPPFDEEPYWEEPALGGEVRAIRCSCCMASGLPELVVRGAGPARQDQDWRGDYDRHQGASDVARRLAVDHGLPASVLVVADRVRHAALQLHGLHWFRCRRPVLRRRFEPRGAADDL